MTRSGFKVFVVEQQKHLLPPPLQQQQQLLLLLQQQLLLQLQQLRLQLPQQQEQQLVELQLQVRFFRASNFPKIGFLRFALSERYKLLLLLVPKNIKKPHAKSLIFLPKSTYFIDYCCCGKIVILNLGFKNLSYSIFLHSNIACKKTSKILFIIFLNKFQRPFQLQWFFLQFLA